MIIFAITNTVTGQHYIGSTRNGLDEQWNRIVAASEMGLDYPLYRDIRIHGQQAFHREIYDTAESREELVALERTAMTDLDAISLRGHKTSRTTIKKKKAAPVESRSTRDFLALLNAISAGDTADESESLIGTTDTEGDEPPLDVRLPDSKTADKTASPAAIQPQKKNQTLNNGTHRESETVTKSTASSAAKTPSKSGRKVRAAIALPAGQARAKRSSVQSDSQSTAQTTESRSQQEGRVLDDTTKKTEKILHGGQRRLSQSKKSINIEFVADEAIDGQLSALGEALDGVLAGDFSALTQLPSELQKEPSTTDRVSTEPPSPPAPPKAEDPVLDCGTASPQQLRQQRLRQAMLRQRAREQVRLQNSNNRRAELAEQLARMEKRVAAMSESGQDMSALPCALSA